MSHSVAVITSSISRDTLRQCLESVSTQSYPCKHYVFIHGKEFWEKGDAILSRFPDALAVYLPTNCGAGGYGMAGVYAAAPFLVKDEVVCYLDDDNWYEQTHVESLVTLIDEANLGWAFSLRRIANKDGSHFCDDDGESLGPWTLSGNPVDRLVDNSCYAVKRDLATRVSHTWYMPLRSDRSFLNGLLASRQAFGCTGQSTVNYRLGGGWVSPETFLQWNRLAQDKFPQGLPWRKRQTFTFGQNGI